MCMRGVEITQNTSCLATKTSTYAHMPEMSCHKRMTQGRKSKESRGVLLCGIIDILAYFTPDMFRSQGEEIWKADKKMWLFFKCAALEIGHTFTVKIQNVSPFNCAQSAHFCIRN